MVVVQWLLERSTHSNQPNAKGTAAMHFAVHEEETRGKGSAKRAGPAGRWGALVRMMI